MGLADVKAALEPPELTRDLGEKSRRSLHETNVVERRKSRRKALRALFVFSLNMVLGIIAGIIYSAAELPSEKASRLNAARLAKQLHGRLSPEDFAHALQTFGVDNATLFEDIAAMEAGTMDDLSYNWGYSGAMFFAFTVATSIGYGSFGGPITSGGRFFTIVYAVIAIPLMLVSFTKLCSALLTMLAQRLAGKKQDLPNKVFRIVDKDASGFLSKRECIDALRTLGLGHFAGAGATVEKHRRFEAAWEVIDPNTMESPAAGQIEVTQFTRLLKILMPHEDHYELFVDLITRGYIAVVAVGFFVTFCFVSTGLFLYLKRHEDWSMLDSLYFTIMTFLTVGIGDLAPEPHPWGYMLAWVAFTFLGLGFTTSMVQALIDENVSLVGAMRVSCPSLFKIKAQSENSFNAVKEKTRTRSPIRA